MAFFRESHNWIFLSNDKKERFRNVWRLVYTIEPSSLEGTCIFGHMLRLLCKWNGQGGRCSNNNNNNNTHSLSFTDKRATNAPFILWLEYLSVNVYPSVQTTTAARRCFYYDWHKLVTIIQSPRECVPVLNGVRGQTLRSGSALFDVLLSPKTRV